MCCIFRNRNETACLVCQSGRSKRYVRIAHVVRVFVEPTSKKPCCLRALAFVFFCHPISAAKLDALYRRVMLRRRQNQPYRQNNANCGLPLMPVDSLRRWWKVRTGTLTHRLCTLGHTELWNLIFSTWRPISPPSTVDSRDGCSSIPRQYSRYKAHPFTSGPERRGLSERAQMNVCSLSSRRTKTWCRSSDTNEDIQAIQYLTGRRPFKLDGPILSHDDQYGNP